MRPCRLLLDLTRRGVTVRRRPDGGVTVRPASALAGAQRDAIRAHGATLGGLVGRLEDLDTDGGAEALRVAFALLSDADVQRLDDEAEHDDFAAVVRLVCTRRKVAA